METNRLRELMAQRGMTQEALAAAAGLEQPHISKLVTGKRRPSLNTAQKVAKALGVGVDDVWPVEGAA